MMKTLTQVLLLLLYSVSAYAESELLENIIIEAGQWQGIDDHEYKILQLTQTGEHRLWRANIANNFNVIRYLPFSNDNINCNHTQCLLTIAEPTRKSTIELTITPSYTGGPLTVLEKSIGNEGNAIVSTTYELRKIEGQSTYRDFWDRHNTRVENLKSNENIGLSGFWIGTLDMGDEVNLLALDMPYQSKSQFIRYLSFGKTSLTNETTFESSDIQKIGDAMLIKTTHKTFANEILIHQRSKDVSVGHIYSYHKGHLLQTGNFKVRRIE